MISFVIIGDIPSKSNKYKRAIHGGLYCDPDVKQYENDFAKQVTYMAKNNFQKEDFLKVEYICYVKNPGQDLGNCEKAISDCLQKNDVIPNDKQIYDLHMVKILSKSGSVNITVSKMQD